MTACFHLDGINPSETDLFIRRAKGLARASAPSLRSLEGISVRPVDFLIFKVFGCARTKSSVMDINLKVTCLVIDLASGAWLAALLLVWLVSV